MLRAALSVVLSFLCLGLVAGAAGAQEATPTPPPPPPDAVGPHTVQPPPPPVLPKVKKDGHRDHKGGGNGGGKSGGKKNGGRAGKRGDRGKGQDALKASCGGFSLLQTYTTWGPALSYGRPVTVQYEATRCSKPDGRALDLSVHGTATVSEVAEAGGALIEAIPFQVTGTWSRPGNDSGWPPDWWECGVRFAEYTWEIPGIYTFHVSAREGSWALDVATTGLTPSTVTWAYDAC